MIFSIISAGTLLSLALTAASIAYQRRKAKKLAAEMDKRKEVGIAYDGEPFYLPVVYGRAKVAGGKTFHKLNNNYNHAAPYLPMTRDPSSGTNYSLSAPSYFVRYTKTAGFGVTTDTEFLFRTEVFWNNVKVVDVTNSSPLDKFIADGYIYTADVKVAGDSDPIETGVGGEYYHRVYRNSEAGSAAFSWNLSGSAGGQKKEFLLVQQAVCYSGINRVVDVSVDDKLWDDDKLRYGQRIHFYKEGGTADPMATANGALITNKFTNTAYASMVFRLNREDYNYSGSPNVAFFVEGMRIYDIEESGGVYSLSSEKLYSNNPALVLLDYLTSTTYGRGVPVSKIDLGSFYNAKTICNRVVREEVDIDGQVNGRRPDIENENGSITSSPILPPRMMPLFECNAVIDTERTIRENVELILESMPGSDLIWSGGIYKLSLAAPRNVGDLEALIVEDLTEKDIVKDQIDISWPDSSNRFNQVVVRFRNEFENFSDDTVTWPLAYSAVYNQYLEEDSGKLLKTEIYLPAVSDPYHALAKAEELTRSSRNAMSVKLKVGKKGLLLEPGDIIRLTAVSAGLSNEIMKVEAVAPSSNMTADLELSQYDLNNFAWNVNDDIPYLDKTIWYQAVPRPTNVIYYTTSSSEIYSSSSGRIEWVAPDDATISDYVVDASLDGGTTWYTLGTSINTYFDLPGLSTGTYTFAVRARKAFTSTSQRAIATDETETFTEFSIEGTASGTLVIYADTADPATNDQSLDLRPSDRWFAVYTYSGVIVPTLPITSGIVFLPLAPRAPNTWTLIDQLGVEPSGITAGDISNIYFTDLINPIGWRPVVGDFIYVFEDEYDEYATFLVNGVATDELSVTWTIFYEDPD